jgi:hypothetical protein
MYLFSNQPPCVDRSVQKKYGWIMEVTIVSKYQSAENQKYNQLNKHDLPNQSNMKSKDQQYKNAY